MVLSICAHVPLIHVTALRLRIQKKRQVKGLVSCLGATGQLELTLVKAKSHMFGHVFLNFGRKLKNTG